jgi:hypothetical protein
MHQKHASFGFDVCRGDGAAASAAATTSHRAVLATTAGIASTPYRDRVFETTTIFLPSVSVAPFTPPPRLG